MNLFLLVPIGLLFVLLMVPYVYKREPGYILIPRLIAAAVCTALLLYSVSIFPGVFWKLTEFSEWLTVVVVGAMLLFYNGLFSSAVHSISEGVEKQKISAAVQSEAESLAHKMVQERDRAEFERLRQEALKWRLDSDFEQALSQRLQSTAFDEEQKRLRARTEGCDIEQAIWIGLHGADKVLLGEGRALDADEVFAIPYWVKFQLNRPPEVVRFNRSQAEVKKMRDVAFLAKRWSKVDGQNAVVADGAVVYRPAR